MLGQHEQLLATCSGLAVKTSDCICHVYPRRFVTQSSGGVSLGTIFRPGETLTAFLVLTPRSFLDCFTSLWQRTSYFPEQLMEPVNGVDSCIHNLSLVLQQPSVKLVQPNLPAKGSSPSKPFCDSLCKLQSNFFFLVSSAAV